MTDADRALPLFSLHSFGSITKHVCSDPVDNSRHHNIIYNLTLVDGHTLTAPAPTPPDVLGSLQSGPVFIICGPHMCAGQEGGWSKPQSSLPWHMTEWTMVSNCESLNRSPLCSEKFGFLHV